MDMEPVIPGDEQRDAATGASSAPGFDPDVLRDKYRRERDKRLRTGLRAIYDWYARNDSLFGCLLRDAEHHDGTRRIAEMRFGPLMAAYRETLGAGLNARQRAMLGLALSFFTWRSLTRDGGLIQAAAVAAMANAIDAA